MQKVCLCLFNILDNIYGRCIKVPNTYLHFLVVDVEVCLFFVSSSGRGEKPSDLLFHTLYFLRCKHSTFPLLHVHITKQKIN